MPQRCSGRLEVAAAGRPRLGDGFLVKLNPAGSAFTDATYLGGSRDERAGSVAVDGDGNAWVVGHTLSTNFPVTSDATQKTFGGDAIDLANTGDGFITKINAAGSQALYSTFVGGSANEYLSAVALTRDGGVLFGGRTASRNLAVTANAGKSRAVPESLACCRLAMALRGGWVSLRPRA